MVGLRALWHAETDSAPHPQPGAMVVARGAAGVVLEMHFKVKE